MTTYRVEIESGLKPTVTVELEQDTKPTQDEIAQALEDLSEQMEMEGYLAEFICTEGGAWTVTKIWED